MKKFLIIGVIVALVLILVGGAGVVYARIRGLDNNAIVTVNRSQTSDEFGQRFGYGPGEMMRGYTNNYGPGGMMQGYGYGYGYGPGGMMGGNGYGPGGMMGGYGYGPGGMMGGRGNGFGHGMMGGRGVGIMHDYLIAAFADAVNLTVEQVDTRLADGETFKEIAIAQGIAQDKLPELVTQVHQAALDKAVADGVITQAQADLMLERMQNRASKGSGLGLYDCPMWDDDDIQQP